jgi:hypothetical protein
MSVWERVQASNESAWAAYEARVLAGTQPDLPGANLQFLLVANALYLSVTALLYMVMRRQESGFNIKRLITVYNVTCVLAAGYCAVSACSSLFGGQERKCSCDMHRLLYVHAQVHIILYKLRKPGTFACNGAADTQREGHHLAWVFWVFYAQKFWEFCDTWFFILRRSFRQVPPHLILCTLAHRIAASVL